MEGVTLGVIVDAMPLNIVVEAILGVVVDTDKVTVDDVLLEVIVFPSTLGDVEDVLLKRVLPVLAKVDDFDVVV